MYPDLDDAACGDFFLFSLIISLASVLVWFVFCNGSGDSVRWIMLMSPEKTYRGSLMEGGKILATPVQERMLGLLPSSIASRAVDLASEGSREYAFPALASQKIFEYLVSQGFVVLGGDLWKKEADGFSCCGENWFSEEASPHASRKAWSRFIDALPEGDYYVTFVVK